MWRPLNPSPLTAAWDEAVDPAREGPSFLWHLEMNRLREKWGIPEPEDQEEHSTEETQ